MNLHFPRFITVVPMGRKQILDISQLIFQDFAIQNLSISWEWPINVDSSISPRFITVVRMGRKHIWHITTYFSRFCNSKFVDFVRMTDKCRSLHKPSSQPTLNKLSNSHPTRLLWPLGFINTKDIDHLTRHCVKFHVWQSYGKLTRKALWQTSITSFTLQLKRIFITTQNVKKTA